MQRIVSGIKPSGDMTLGNYIGAISQFVKLQDEYEMFIFIADLHAITVYQDPQELYARTKEIAALYIAAGLNPKRVCIFKQSDIQAHAEIGWVMQCHAYFGELNRMTQFKDKSANNQLDGVSGGLFAYPALMAADILLYDAALVPVGEDQLQHLELTRTIAERFNSRYGDTFTIPQGKTLVSGARVMSLQTPTKKMSKSEDNEKGTILLLEDVEKVRKKIMSAVTDSGSDVSYDKMNKPGISNLIDIFSALSNRSVESIVEEYHSAGYGTFKRAVADCVCEFLEGYQTRVHTILAHGEIDTILQSNAAYANTIASEKRNTIYSKLGLTK